MTRTCTAWVRPAGALIAGTILLLGLLALAKAPPTLGAQILAGILALTTLAGLYYTITSTIWMERGLSRICSSCPAPRIHPWIQAASCKAGEAVVCYSNVSRSIYTAEGELEEAEPVPGMHCAWALEAEAVGEGSYRGEFLVRGGARVYRVRGLLRVSRIQD